MVITIQEIGELYQKLASTFKDEEKETLIKELEEKFIIFIDNYFQT